MMMTQMHMNALKLMDEAGKMELEDANYDLEDFEYADYKLQMMIDMVAVRDSDDDILNKLCAERDRIEECIEAFYDDDFGVSDYESANEN